MECEPIYIFMQNVRYDYSSVYVMLPPELANEIVEWGSKDVTDDDIYVSQNDPTYGREDQIHVTILYGLHSESSEEIKPLLEGAGKIKVKLGPTDLFLCQKFDVVTVYVISPDLRKLNAKLSTLEHTNKHGGYKPHVTVAYVKKGKGWKHRGLELWDGREFTCDHCVFSSKNGTKEKILF